MHSNFIQNRYFWGMLAAVLMTTLTAPQQAAAYPLDGYAETDIGRLEAASRIEQGTLKGRKTTPWLPCLLGRRSIYACLIKRILSCRKSIKKFSAQIKISVGRQGQSLRYLGTRS